MRFTLLTVLLLLSTSLYSQKEKKDPPPSISTICSPKNYVCNLLPNGANIGISFSSKIIPGIVNNSNCLEGSPYSNNGCLYSSDNQSWFIIEVINGGNLSFTINSSTNRDIDGAIWGTINNDLSNTCTALSNAPFSCDFLSSSIISLTIMNAQVGQKYLLLLANYSNSILDINLNQPQGGQVSYKEIRISTPNPDPNLSALAGCYSFESSYRDSVSQSDGIASGSLTFTADRFGQANKALKLDGNSLLTINSSRLLNPSFTYSCWFKINELPPNGTLSTIISIGGAGSDQVLALNNNYHVYSTPIPVDPIFFSYFQYDTEPTVDYFNYDISLGRWYHYVGVKSTDSLKTYINGVLISKKVSGKNARYTQSTAKIGSRYNNTSKFKGELDDVLIFNRDLTNNEVASLYNINNCQFVQNPCQNILVINDNLNVTESKEASLYITSNGVNNINSNGNIIFSAGRSILLNPGFKVESGGVFKTKMGGCSN